MEKKIEIKIPKHNYHVFLAMHIPENMKAPELLRIIEAKELVEFGNHPEHVREGHKYRSSGELENRMRYDVHTSDPDKTVDLIKKYNHRNWKEKE